MSDTASVLISVLGGGVSGGIVLGIYDRISNRRFNKLKQEGDTKLSEAQYDEIASRASQVRTAEQIQAGDYWMAQFAAIRTELGEQQDWRRRAIRKWHEHKRWDDARARQIENLTGEPVEPAPSLDPDEDDPYSREEPMPAK